MPLSLAVKLLLTRLTISWESLLTSNLRTYISLDSLRLTSSSSYSNTLFVALNLNLIAQFNLWPSRLLKTTLAFEPVYSAEPSTNMFHVGGSMGFITSSIPGTLANSITKSVRVWALIAALLLKRISNLLSLTTHFNNLLRASGFQSTCLRGKLVNTCIVWAWKYDLNFLEAMINVKASFSISG